MLNSFSGAAEKLSFMQAFLQRPYGVVKILGLAAILWLALLLGGDAANDKTQYYLYSVLPYYFLEAVILAHILEKLKIKYWIVLLILLSTFIQVHVLFHTSIKSWAPDIRGHRDYIYYLATHAYIPPVPSGWQRQQPFLYYEWCALAFNIGAMFNLKDPWFAVRVASRILYLGYIIFGVLIVERFRLPALAKLAVIAIMLFWPSAHIISTRTNSDIGFQFFFMAALYFMQCWYERLEHKHFYQAAICAGLSLLCKATGVITFIMVGALAGHALITRRIDWRYFWNKRYVWPAIIVAVCLAGYFGRIGYYNWVYDANLQWFANVQPGTEPAYTPAKPYHFIIFHALDFIVSPGVDWQVADQNIYTYWDGLFRTLLYDDGARVSGPIYLTGTISFLWVCLFGLVIWQLMRFGLNTASSRPYAVILAAFLAITFAMMVQRGLIPDCRMFNGRKVFPLIPIMAMLAMLPAVTQRENGNMAMYRLYCAVGIGFAVFSLALTLRNVF